MNKDIKLCVPAIYDMEYLRNIIKLNSQYKDTKCSVYEVYGSLPQDIIGNLRPYWSIRSIDVNGLKEYISVLHTGGIYFDYVINSTIYPVPGQYSVEDILNFVGELIDIGIDSMTVTNSFLMVLLERYFPKLRINASICNEISTLHQVKEFEELGVDCLVLDRDVNRNFEFLRKVREYTHKDIKLLCNSSCLFQCINVQYHANFSSFLSNSSFIELNDHTSMTCEYPFCSLYCKYRRFRNPIEHIKMCWIRPEDLRIYSELGIDCFKLDGRDRSSSFMLEVIEAYLSQTYRGNLLRLLNKRYIKDLSHLECISNSSNISADGLDIENTWKIWIDNKSLDGFINYLVNIEHRCMGDCSNCNICDTMENKIRIDTNWQKQICGKLEKDIRILLSAS